MKKIVILSPAHPLRGGIAASSERLAQELQTAGHQVVIYSFSLQYPNFLFPGKTQFSSDPPPPGLDIRTRINSINPLNWLSVGRELRRLRPDLIVSRYWLPFMGPCLGTILRLARQNGHTRTVSIADNIIPHEGRPGDRAFTKYYIGANDGFVVMSRSVGEDLRQFTATKPFRFVPHPIYDIYGKLTDREEALRFLHLPAGPRYLLFFGFIRDYKGLDLLLDALADERVQRLNLRLLVAGEFYGNEEKYRQQIERLGLADRLVLRTEYIPADEVRHYFGAADLVVQPYRSATQSGISQMAYHFEKPMVVTRVGGLPEIVPHGRAGYVVEVSAPAIAEAIHDFFTHQKMETLTAGVRREKDRFSWKNLADALLELG